MKKKYNRNKILKKAGVLLVAVVMILSTMAVMANTSEQRPESKLQASNTNYGGGNFAPLDDILLSEGFENGVMPPSGWTTFYQGSPSARHWQIVDGNQYPDFVHTGRYAAWVNYDEVYQQDEWLVTPAIDLNDYESAQLVFWAESDTMFPGATMELYINQDLIWDMIRDENWATFEYREMIFDLTSYCGQTIEISWRYVGLDGESFGLDDVLVTGEPGGGQELEADANGPYYGYVDIPIRFDGTATGGTPPYEYLWQFGNGDTSSEEDPVYTYPEAGNYTVTLWVRDSEQTIDSDVTWALVTEIEPLVADADGPYGGEVGEGIQFTGSAHGGVEPYTWLWDFGNGDISPEQNPIYAYPESGEYTVNLTVEDDIGNVAYDETTATITEVQGEPELVIESIEGGIGITAVIKNIGDADATDIEWTITIEGGFIILTPEALDTIDNLAPDESAEITMSVLGIGLGIITEMPTITVTAEYAVGVFAEDSVEAKILLFFVII